MNSTDLNMPLRAVVIEETLRIEHLSKEVLKIIIRVFKDDSKTLSHKGSSLTLKNRIDILYDLEEIENEYNDFIKILEIRNQFAHNSEANSFLSLDKIDIKLNKYLKSLHPKLFENVKNREEEEL